MQPVWKRRLRWAAVGLGLAILAGLATLWLLFQHIPSWYRPTLIPPDQDQKIKADLANTSQAFYETLKKARQPFEFRLTQDQINAWIANRESIWPLSREWLPPAISDPFVAIEPGLIRLAATYRSGALQAVVSADFTASADRDGISLKLAGAGAGSLPLPLEWIADEIKTREHLWTGQRSKYQLSDTPIPPLSSLPRGAIFPNAWLWVWVDDRVPFRVIKVDCQQGVLVLGIEPLPRQSLRR